MTDREKILLPSIVRLQVVLHAPCLVHGLNRLPLLYTGGRAASDTRGLTLWV